MSQQSLIYTISSRFDATGKCHHQMVKDVEVNITVKDHNDKSKDLRHKEPSQGKCTSGVFLAPDGNNYAILLSNHKICDSVLFLNSSL